MITNREIDGSMVIRPEELAGDLRPLAPFQEGIRRAPKRNFTLTKSETVLAVKNALRYVPEKWHEALAPEFLNELLTRGRIYAYRFRPSGGLSRDCRSMIIRANV